MSKLKVLAVSDLHQKIIKWKNLCEEVLESRPDIVCICGDLFPKYDGLKSQLEWINSFIHYTKKIANSCDKLFLILGNDDNIHLIPVINELQEEGKFVHLHNKSFEYSGIHFCGMPWVSDHPFGYKSFCRKEFYDEYGIDQKQYYAPLDLDSESNYIKIPDYKCWLDSHQISIYDQLSSIASPIANKNEIDKSIWLIHNPPKGFGLSTISTYEDVGSIGVTGFIQDFQPAVTLHGHIHESPYYSKIWQNKIGKTLAIQPGQVHSLLHYSTFECEISNNKIEIDNVWHSTLSYSFNKKD